MTGSKAESEFFKLIDPTGATGVFDSYVKNDKVGVITASVGMLSAGKIRGFTKHGINQAISRDGVGVATTAIADAVKSPLKVEAAKRGATKYIGRDATVLLNNTGKVITTWARTKAGRRIQ